MYSSVTEYFERERRDLVKMLGNPGGFWPAVKDNTISNEDLNRVIAVSQTLGKYNSSVYQASVELMRARLTGKLPNPG